MSETLLIILSAVEIVFLIGVLAIGLLIIAGQLRHIVSLLHEVAWGARAVERQLKAASGNVSKINFALTESATIITTAADKAQRLTGIGVRR